MKICPNCDNPTSNIGTGALQTSSNHCPKCNALISSGSSRSSQPTTPEFRPNITSVSKRTRSSSTRMATGDGSITTGPLIEEVDKDSHRVGASVENESVTDMNTETHNQEPVLSENDPLPNAEEREEARRLSLSRQGFVLEEDAHGLRLSGVASRPGGLSSELSPYDVVRLAAELEGGVVPLEQRKRCPKCEAVVAPGDKQCQWCSELLDT